MCNVDELELREKEFCSLPRPKERNYRSLINYLYNKRDVCEEEEKYFLYPEQMVSLANGTDNSWLDSKVEEVLDRLPNSDVSQPFRGDLVNSKKPAENLYA